MSGRITHVVMVIATAASMMVSPVYAQDQPAAAQTDQTPGVLPPPPQYQPPVETQGPPAAPTRNLGLSTGKDYSKPNSWFPDLIAPYTPIKVTKPELVNTPRINQLIQDGKLNLSLEDAVSLGLENNLAIAIERYVPWLDEASLLLAKSGANGRIQFDPSVTSTLSLAQSTTPINNPLFAGITSIGSTTTTVAPGLTDHTFTANFGYTQGFATGTQAQVTFNNSRTSTNFGGFDLFNPYEQSTLTVELTQPLLNGFGRIPNTRYIIEAKNTVKVGESQFAQQVITTVTQVATDYWELVFARENVKVEQVAVAADQQLYNNNKKQLEIGTMAPLDVITAQSQLATDQQALVQAQTTQLLDETTLLVAITKDPLSGTLNGVEIIPTTTIFNPNIENISLNDAVKEAWQKRPELQQAALNLKNAGVEVKATRNSLLPQLNLFGEYQAAGLGGVVTPATPTGAFLAESPIFLPGDVLPDGTIPAGSVPFGVSGQSITTPGTPLQGGLSDDLNAMIRGRYPTLEAGINLTLPIRNRAAQANNATAQLNEREQEVQYLQTQNTIVLNVRQALITLVQDRAAITAAEEARVFAQQSYDDEVKKLQLGTSTAFTVIQKQQLLTAAEGTELRDRINLIEAELNFNQAMGRTLDVHNITVAGALKGTSNGVPNIPGTPDTDAQAGHR
ncbi:MAG TPA: TolC family protein [Candidatus Acidoferrales bacterium]|jgi:outer membrane protein|nr:TolC family protein [Candidatus Acidoferrales bacterium]